MFGFALRLYYNQLYDLRMCDIYTGGVEFRPKRTKLKGWQKNCKKVKKHR